MNRLQTETAETLKTQLFNVMLVFSGSLGPPVSPLSKRNEKQETRNGSWRWRKAIAFMHKLHHLRRNTKDIGPDEKSSSWRTRNRQVLIPDFSLESGLTVVYGAFRSTKSKQFVFSGLKQEVGFLSQEVIHLIYLQFNTELWRCKDQIYLILSSCHFWDSRGLIERFSKPLGVRKAQRILMKCWNVAYQIRSDLYTED